MGELKLLVSWEVAWLPGVLNYTKEAPAVLCEVKMGRTT